jgi:tetratricopeptide (TPR) repeat protein
MRSNRPRARWRWWAAPAALLVSALALGGWQLTRFDPLGRARADYERGDYATALRAAREHMARSPGDRRAALMAARCLSRLGEPRAAARYYDRAGPLGREDLLAFGFGLASAGEAERAAAAYSEVLARWPDDERALQGLGAVSIGQKRWPQVLDVGRRLARTPSGRVAGETMIGVAHHESRRYALASDALERVLRLDPELRTMPLPASLFWSNLALDLVAEGRTQEARRYLTRALASRRDAALIELLGVTYEHEGDSDRAERCWREAVALDPTISDAWLGLGRMALRRRQAEEAIGLLRRAAALSPDSLEATYGLSQAYRQLGHDRDADFYQERSIELRRQRARLGRPEPRPALAAKAEEEAGR